MRKQRNLNNNSPCMDIHIRLLQKQDCPRVPDMVYTIVYRGTCKGIATDVIQRGYIMLSISLLSLAVYLATESLLLASVVIISLPALIYAYFVFIQSKEAYHMGNDTSPGVDFFKYWSDNDAGHFLWVAEHDGKVIGSAAVRNLSDKCGEVLRVVTDPDYQGRKVAERLMCTLIENCKSRGLDELVLTTTFHQVPAHKLYMKLGFNLVDQFLTGLIFLRFHVFKFHLKI